MNRVKSPPLLYKQIFLSRKKNNPYGSNKISWPGSNFPAAQTQSFMHKVLISSPSTHPRSRSCPGRQRFQPACEVWTSVAALPMCPPWGHIYKVKIKTVTSRCYMAGAMWNWRHLSASSVDTIQTMDQFTVSLYSKLHTLGALVFSCNLPPALLAEWPGSFKHLSLIHIWRCRRWP